MYSEVFLDHFKNPRNVGELAPPAVMVEISNPICGDILRLSALFQDGRIAEVRYKVRGCGVRPSESASWRLGELAPFVWGLLTLCNGQCNAVRNLQTSNHLQMPAGYANRHSDFKKGL